MWVYILGKVQWFGENFESFDIIWKEILQQKIKVRIFPSSDERKCVGNRNYVVFTNQQALYSTDNALLTR